MMKEQTPIVSSAIKRLIELQAEKEKIAADSDEADLDDELESVISELSWTTIGRI